MKSFPRKTGRWWKVFNGADQAAKYMDAEGKVVATDGSYQKSTGASGAGIVSRPKDGITARETITSGGGSLVPEIHAARMALKAVDPWEELTIITDSACLLWITHHFNQQLLWRDYDKHQQKEAILLYAEDLAKRVGKTTLVKVSSHKGCYLNEQADEQATAAANKQKRPEHEYSTQKEPDVTLLEQEPGNELVTTRLRLILGELRRELTIRRKKDFLLTQKQTLTRSQLTYPNSGRQYIGKALQRLNPKEVKRIVQVLSHTFPSQAKLHLFGMEKSALCPFCKSQSETTEHFSQTCPAFHDARTKAHDAITSAIRQELQKHMSKEWKLLPEQNLENTGLAHKDKWRKLKPDIIAVNEDAGRIVIFEFTRSAGFTSQDTHPAHARKQDKYGKMAKKLAELNRDTFPAGVKLVTLVMTYAAAIDEPKWRSGLRELLKEEKDIDKTIQASVEACIEGFSEMVDIRAAQRASARKTVDKP
jgi:ribonuclease HI